MKRSAFALVAPTILLAAGPVLAQSASQLPVDEPALAPSSGAIITPRTPPPEATRGTVKLMDEAFARADRNKDGVLSRAEAQVFTEVRLNFEEIDANKDGALSRAEFEKSVR